MNKLYASSSSRLFAAIARDRGVRSAAAGTFVAVVLAGAKYIVLPKI